MALRRLALFAVWCSAVAALAEPSSAPSRLWLTAGGAGRAYQQTFDGRQANTGGVSPTTLHLSAAHFFLPNLGVNLESRGELFFARPVDAAGQPSGGGLSQPAFDVSVAAAGRLLPARWLSLELQLGWGLGARSAVDLSGPKTVGALFTAPSVGLAVGLTPVRAVSGQVYARVEPLLLGLGTPSGFSGATVVAGVQASLGALRLGDVQLGVAATVEYAGATGRAPGIDVTQHALRFGLGVSLLRWVEEPPAPKPVMPPLKGRVVSAKGDAVAGALVRLDGQLGATTDGNGAFSFAGVPRGKHRLVASFEGRKAPEVEVVAPASTVVVLRLDPPAGPGRLSGVVRGGEQPLAGAEVLAVEAKLSAKTDAEGRYQLAQVGPGPVTVQVQAEGFTAAEEVVQLAPGGEAVLDVTLTPRSATARATLRGLVRSKAGATLKATVRVVELKLKLAVKDDGRFVAEVPSGKYTLIIEARGFVTQTKTVEVSGGDQAIFHTELEPLR